jgi:integrase
MAKRAPGEGSVRQRADGRWEARLSYIDPVVGQRRSTSFYGATAEAVRAQLGEARGRVKVEAPVQDSPMLLAEWIRHWSATSLEASPRKPSTRQWYRDMARIHLIPPPLGIIPLGKIRKSHIDGLLVRLRDAGLADSTVRGIYTVLRTILADAKLDDLIADNPATRVKRPRVARTEAKYLSATEVVAVLDAAKGQRYHPVLVAIAATGLRRGEVLALRWDRVDLDAGTLRVAATIGRTDGKLMITEPKTTRSRRTVPISPAVVMMLKTQRAHQAAERLQAGPLWTDSGLVFTDELGGPVEPRRILRAAKAAAVKAGVDNINVHTLRHSAATAWLDAGVHIRAVADLLGHSSIAITGDIYGHASDATTRAAIDGLSNTLGL